MKQPTYHKWQQVYVKDISTLDVHELVKELCRLDDLFFNEKTKEDSAAKITWMKEYAKGEAKTLVDHNLAGARKDLDAARKLTYTLKGQIDSYLTIQYQIEEL